LVSVVGNTVAPPVDILVTELARRYELLVESLEFHRLVLPDEAATMTVYNNGRPIRILPFIVVCRR
jgi:hypothetical protein